METTANCEPRVERGASERPSVNRHARSLTLPHAPRHAVAQRRLPRSTVFLLACLTALTALAAPTSHRLYLSGHDKDDAVPWDFFCTSGAKSGFWTNLPVPLNWELLGFGTLTYYRDSTNPPAEQGLYRHTFKAPASWAKTRVFLNFDGVMTDTSATLNGQCVGPKHQGAYYHFKYEVTSLLHLGQTNLLEVTVDKKSADLSVNKAERKADYWMYGGIFRPVYLEAVPPQFIDRVAINAQASGDFLIHTFIDGQGAADAVEAQITTLDGKRVGSAFSTPLSGSQSALTTKISSPRLWTAETPNLYQVQVSLKAGKTTLHQITQRFGFRTFEVRDGDGLYLNGQRVILKGANRHSFWPESGRCLSDAVHRLDIQVMKDMNMNAVRMSHYPPDARFLDLCDELGLYVLDELGGWHQHYDNIIGPERVREMVQFNVNHPSILFWDNGNEGGFNTNLDHLFAQYDPQQRRVLHPWALFGGVDTSHYLSYDEAKTNCSRTNIYMPTEFMHGLYDGGAGAGLGDYWKLMTSSRVLGGGFIWALLDEGVKHHDTGDIDVHGNYAPDGIVGPYREKEGSFYAIKEIWSPVILRETHLGPDFSGRLTFENHFSFTDLSQCRFDWELRQLRGPGDSKAGYRILAKGQLTAPSIPPGQSDTLPLVIPNQSRPADVLALRVSDPKGREIWTWTLGSAEWGVRNAEWGLGSAGRGVRSAEREMKDGSAGRVTVKDLGDTLVARAGELTLSFSKQDGFLASARRAGQSFSLTNGPRPVHGNASLTNLTHRMDGGEAIIDARYSGELSSVQWRIQPSGWVQCDYAYTAAGPQNYFGVGFDYPESQVKSKKWLGQGPYRVWKNRLEGGSLNVWQNDYNNTVTGWSNWIYPEFKGCFAEVRWMQLQTTEGAITAMMNPTNTFVQVLTPDQPPTNLVGQAGIFLPKTGLAFLQAIPPVGSKFKPAKDCGPQSQLTVGQGEYKGSVSLYFGPLPESRN
jgi:hypothetical protein